jgi:hypothetical protein
MRIGHPACVVVLLQLPNLGVVEQSRRRRLLALVDTAFAWKGVPEVWVFHPPGVLHHIRTSLLRHAPIALIMTVAFTEPSDPPVDVAAVPRLSQLHLTGDQLVLMSDLLAHPALQNLPHLSLTADGSALEHLLPLAAALPRRCSSSGRQARGWTRCCAWPRSRTCRCTVIPAAKRTSST